MHFLRSTILGSIVSLALLELSQVSAQVESSLKDQYDGYGVDWMFIPDGNGNPQVAVLKGHSPDGRIITDDQLINYILFTKSGPVNGTMLFINDPDSLKNSDFSSSRKTKFIAHGWKSSSSSAGLLNLRKAYVRNGDLNVIMVDWEPLASSTFYLGPMQNTGRVGKETGKFIDYLVEEGGLNTEDVHFIGHSLGAHVAGNTGSSVTSGRLSRITGLDPALPGFHLFTTTNGRLDASDADFVDVIHSCGGILGWLQPIGDADFYPNGGVAVQPGCCCLPEFTEACSHGRSFPYFTESINTGEGLEAIRCDTWDNYNNGKCADGKVVLLGEHVDRTAKGSYYLRTNPTAPYAYDSAKNFIVDTKTQDDCDEPGGWTIDDYGSPICGSNVI